MGAVMAKTQFCTMGAVSDWINIGDTGRMRAWVFAMAVALAGVLALEAAGTVDLYAETFPPYRSANFSWLRYILGGLMFGAGMTLASGCGARTLVRIGGGNLKSLVVAIVLAISAYMTLKGLFAVFRVAALDPVGATFSGPQDLPSLLAPALGVGRNALLVSLAVVIVAGLLAFVFKSRDFRTFDNVLGG